MTPKQQYTLAYRTFRQSNGSACTSYTVARQNAWKTFIAERWHFCGEDPILTVDPSLYRSDMPHARAKISLLYRFASDFHLSRIARS